MRTVLFLALLVIFGSLAFALGETHGLMRGRAQEHRDAEQKTMELIAAMQSRR